MTRANYIGAPEFFELNQACRSIAEAFPAGGVYLVGSALTTRDHRDVDVRCILPDDDFARMFPNGGGTYDAYWSLLCVAISHLLAKRTGLKIDFQIQQMTKANQEFPGARSALGMHVCR